MSCEKAEAENDNLKTKIHTLNQEKNDAVESLADTKRILTETESKSEQNLQRAQIYEAREKETTERLTTRVRDLEDELQKLVETSSELNSEILASEKDKTLMAE